MKYIKESAIIFGITMIGEFLNRLLPLPVPAGVYGLFLLLLLLCTKVLKLIVTCLISTVVVMGVTGKVTEFMVKLLKKNETNAGEETRA